MPEQSQPTVSRRTVLATSAAVAASTAAGSALGVTASSAPAHAARADIGVSAYPFPLNAVTLLAGPFQANTGRTQEYLRFIDPDRLLHTFRLNVGLSSS